MELSNSHRINLPEKWLKFMKHLTYAYYPSNHFLVLWPLILTPILQVKNNDYLHFIDEKTEEQNGK